MQPLVSRSSLVPLQSWPRREVLHSGMSFLLNLVSPLKHITLYFYTLYARMVVFIAQARVVSQIVSAYQLSGKILAFHTGEGAWEYAL